MTKLVVTASSNDAVSAAVQYDHGKPNVYRGKVGSSGTYQKQWKVPKSAPLGKASVKVTVASKPTPYSATITFTVIK